MSDEPIERGDIFTIQVFSDNDEEIGYINARLNRKEWVLYVARDNFRLRFELLDYLDSGNINKRIFPVVKALLTLRAL